MAFLFKVKIWPAVELIENLIQVSVVFSQLAPAHLPIFEWERAYLKLCYMGGQGK